MSGCIPTATCEYTLLLWRIHHDKTSKTWYLENCNYTQIHWPDISSKISGGETNCEYSTNNNNSSLLTECDHHMDGNSQYCSSIACQPQCPPPTCAAHRRCWLLTHCIVSYVFITAIEHAQELETKIYKNLQVHAKVYITS